MVRKMIEIIPETEGIIEKMGVRIKKARLRRNIRAEQLAKSAGISKGTLSAIEKGMSTVSIGAYAAVLCALDMGSDLELIAVDEEEKQRCLEMNLRRRKRAARRKG